MAKKSSGGQGRIRFLYADVAGDNETIQESMKALQLAMAKSMPNSRPVISPGANGRGAAAAAIEYQQDDTDLAEVDNDMVVDVPAETKPRTKRKPPQMSLVKDLDLRPEGEPTLREFFAELNPDTQTQKVAVFVYYLHHKAGIEAITANHVFTCFKEVGVKPPGDLPQIIRNTASKHGWVDCSNADDIKITNRGEALVEHDLLPTGNDAPR
jgi:hypothetical protein